MDESILESIKKMIGISPDSSDFDVDIISFINSAFFTLKQIGVGSSKGFSVSGKEEKWIDFSDDESLINGVKPYIQQKVRLQFDPPTNSFLESSIRENIKEYEWRLGIQGEGGFNE